MWPGFGYQCLVRRPTLLCVWLGSLRAAIERQRAERRKLARAAGAVAQTILAIAARAHGELEQVLPKAVCRLLDVAALVLGLRLEQLVVGVHPTRRDLDVAGSDNHGLTGPTGPVWPADGPQLAPLDHFPNDCRVLASKQMRRHRQIFVRVELVRRVEANETAYRRSVGGPDRNHRIDAARPQHRLRGVVDVVRGEDGDDLRVLTLDTVNRVEDAVDR